MGFTCDENGVLTLATPLAILFTESPDSVLTQRMCLSFCSCPDIAPELPATSTGARPEQCVVDDVADAAADLTAAAAAGTHRRCTANNYREPTPDDAPIYQTNIVCSEFYGHPVDADCELANDEMHEEILGDQTAPDFDPEGEEFLHADTPRTRPELFYNRLPMTFPKDGRGNFSVISG